MFRKSRLEKRSISSPSHSKSTTQTPKIVFITDIVLKWAQIVAIVAAGFWAYYHFALEAENAWNVNIELTTETLSYGNNTKLLIVHIKSKNSGKAALDIDKSNGKFLLTANQVADGLESGSTITPEDGEPVASVDLMPDEGWSVLPSSEAVDTVAIVIPNKGNFVLKAELSYGEDSVSAAHFVHMGR